MQLKSYRETNRSISATVRRIVLYTNVRNVVPRARGSRGAASGAAEAIRVDPD